MAHFSIKEGINFGWRKFWERPWFFIGISLFIFIINSIENSITKHSELAGILFFFFINVPLIMGIIALSLRAQENIQTLAINDLWHPHPYWKFVGALVLLYVSIFLGALLVVVVLSIPELHAMFTAQDFMLVYMFVLLPIYAILGFVIATLLSVRIFFATFIVIDRDLAPIAAFRESIRITKGNSWQLVGFFIVLGLINILGALCLIAGLLISYPISILAAAHAYRFLEHQASEIAPAPAAPTL